MTFRFASIAAGFSALLLISCGMTPSKVAGSDSRVKLEQWRNSAQDGIEETDELLSVKIPVVDFGKLPGAFGKPYWSAGTKGQYNTGYGKIVRIADGECYDVSILGTPSPAPLLVDAPSVLEPGLPGEMDENPRKWFTVEVPGLNRTLRYYFATMAFGDTDDVWETEPFSVAGPDGAIGFYQARVECHGDQVAQTMFSKLRVR